MDLTTTYMGLVLKNPLVASASPLTGEISSIREIEDAGAAAIVLPSLFQEEIEGHAARYERMTSANADSWPESASNFPVLVDYQQGPTHYLDLIRRAVEAIHIPVIASLNGVTNEGWIDYATLAQDAGASAIELNVYFIATDLELDGRAVEKRYLDILRAVRSAVTIPIAVKLSPYFSAIGHMATALQDAGADGLVLFNRFYQPDIDPVTLSVLTDMKLSQPIEIRLPLLWISVLASRVRASLAASTGVTSSDEVVKYLLAGADVVMTTSALLRMGPGHIKTLIRGLTDWLEAREFDSLDPVRGIMSRASLKNPLLLERANYMKILHDYQPGHLQLAPRPKAPLAGRPSR